MQTSTNSTELSVIYHNPLQLKHHSHENYPMASMIYPHITHLLSHMPAYVDWKNTESMYLGCSEYTAIGLAGLSSPQDIIGRIDTDLVWGKNEDAKTYKTYFLQPDQQILTGDVLVLLGKISHENNNYKNVIIKKYPLVDEKQNIIGIISYLMDISDHTLPAALQLVKQLGVKLTPAIITEVKKNIIHENLKALSLSRREEECLYYLLRNHTAKEIAKALGLSHRTVESYLNNLKDKFNCVNKTTLIIKALELGSLNLIPDSILLNKYN